MCLIKFGKEKHLKEIQNGKLRFSQLAYYRTFEDKDSNVKNAIGDKFEGVEYYTENNDNTKICFRHPSINNGKTVNITSGIQSFAAFPNTNRYKSCFSYFTEDDVINHTIFDDKILENSEWNFVLFIPDANAFLQNLKKVCSDMQFRAGIVRYEDFSNGISNGDEFIKSKAYEYQKEFCISIVPPSTNDKFITIPFEKVQSFIVPAKDFRESFIVEYN